MEALIEKYKGIQPGLIVERELKKRNLKKGPFALSLNEYPQVLNDITKGKRGLTTALSLKIDNAFGLEEGTMLVLQAYYEIKKERQKSNSVDHPNLSKLRKVLFWDTDISKIDWQRQYKAVIKRVFERGDKAEKQEIIDFYGDEKVASVIGHSVTADDKLSILQNPSLK